MRCAATAVLVALIATACVPMPHRRHTIAPVEGTLTDEGVPVVGATVMYRAGFGERSAHQIDSVRSAAGGAFTFEGERDWAFVFVPLAHCMYRWSIAVEGPGGETAEVRSDDYGACNAPSHIVLECDLAWPDLCRVTEPEYFGRQTEVIRGSEGQG